MTSDLVIETKDGGMSWVTDEGEAASAITGFLVLHRSPLGNKPRCRAPGGMKRGSGVTRVTVSRDLIAAGLSVDEWSEHLDAMTRIEADRSAAKARATKLLVSHLSQTQRAEFLSNGTFRVNGPSGRRYHVVRGSYRNVSVFENGVETASLCVHITAGVPDEDTMLMQKLMLEDAEQEKEVLGAANWYPPRRDMAVKSRPDGTAAVVAVFDGRRVPLTERHKVFCYSFDDMRPPRLACVVVDGFVATLAPE